MKKFTAILCASALVTFVPVTPALAQGKGAVITKEGACNGFVPTPSGGAGPFITGEITLNVTNKAGNGTIVCKFDVPEGQRPARATRATNFGCAIIGIGAATSARMVATPSGEATLTCHYKANS